MSLEDDIKKITAQIEDLKKRFPAHSLKGHMFAELEDLEETLEKLTLNRNKAKEKKIMGHKFNPKSLAKLDNPERRKLLPPEEVISQMGIFEGQKVVDLGCGIGYLTFPLAKAVGVSGLVYGLDILEEMLEEARHRYNNSEELCALNNIKFLQSKESMLPLAEHTADVVVMVNVFHELEEPSKLLIEIKRILKNSGKIFIIEWKKEKMEIGPPIEHRKSKDDIINSLQSNGYISIKSMELQPAHLLVEALSN